MSELDADQIRAEARGYSEELAEWRTERDALQAEVDLLKRDNLLLRDERDGEAESRNDLQDEVAELRKDKARLDWMQAHEKEVSWRRKSWAVICRLPRIENVYADDKCTGMRTYPTLREALDRAMEGAPKK